MQPKPPRAYESVDEIHERLLITAASASARGEEEEEETERRASEKASAYTPFSRKKVNKAKERAQILEWARKRQGGGGGSPKQIEHTAPSASAGALPPAGRAPSLHASVGAASSLSGAARKGGAARGGGEKAAAHPVGAQS